MFDEFPQEAGLIHLNHAAVAPWPKRTCAAVKAFADENMRVGSSHYPRWLATEQRLRERLARLMNAPAAEDVALLKSTSEGLSVVAYGLNWAEGDNIVLPTHEFPSNRVVWESLQYRFGVEVRQVDISADDPEAALLAAINPRTRLLSVSAVQYARGLRLDLPRLGEACRSRGVLFCVDAIQQLGALPLDVQACHIDFLAADGHKWLLGPEGLAVFYCRAELRDALKLNQFGWHMLEAAGDYDRSDWAVAADARRFECGSSNLLGIHALEASVSLLEELGMGFVGDALKRNVEYLIDLLDQTSFEVVSPRDPLRRAGIVSFNHADIDLPALYRSLMDQGVLCALRGGAIRFSPHFYTPAAHLERAVELATMGYDPTNGVRPR
ncbi:Selenocysteine lyase/Cysteine desulfurase [Ectothiorhodosinus mongolicus]|uniref:Selenocysteine lyase/Cysteine desulfurase n=1 Tax=Ectothiorhodosinus mongolicus TaxID=233100 RepID=A0A1R3VMT1_9GAMM|nr:aminotransferase class V-fold PLP-dependent enzyme [Ectothiorhodosinus mongolicus]ULX56279.1 aminotransferase class V-fold PLP-dependent enzyme [Ectothiorhodosinus mongolicus]SIT65784.1 Selenocysteine lyase/Cysteine desulfurase [Ectothiorhodosinus mongolicus]